MYGLLVITALVFVVIGYLESVRPPRPPRRRVQAQLPPQGTPKPPPLPKTRPPPLPPKSKRAE